TRARSSSITRAGPSPSSREERRLRSFGSVAALLLTLMARASGQDAPWSEMEKFFAPPNEYKGKFGDYRPVLQFDDGSPVKSPEDWPRRREEIRKYWHGVMGAW